MLDTFLEAIRQGWRPQLDVVIRDEANITYFPMYNMYVVPSDQGAVQLDEEDYVQAKEYLEEKQWLRRKK